MEESITRGGYYSGTSGLVLPYPNKLSYPPDYQDKSRLTFYGSLLNTIEINSSFYKIPMPSTVAKWAAEVPDDFRFTFKLWKEITHQKGLVYAPEAVHRFMEVISMAGDKKGCLLVQFPPGLKADRITRVMGLLDELALADPDSAWKLALEFRHPSWYGEETAALLEQYGVVIHDKPPAVTSLQDQPADFIYLRFHGPGGDYKGSYPDDVLMEYAGYINEWRAEGKTVYTYFNNTMGAAFQNLQTLKEYVTAMD